MKWLKDKLFRYQLQKTIDEQKKFAEPANYNTTQHIALLFDESQIDSMEDLNSYINLWTKKGKKVETFSFIDVKAFPPDEVPSNKICHKNLNWYDIPSGNNVKTFKEKTFDILITINPEGKNFMRFLTVASRSKFKIGLLPDELELYNLILDIQEPKKVRNIMKDIELTLDKLAV